MYLFFAPLHPHFFQFFPTPREQRRGRQGEKHGTCQEELIPIKQSKSKQFQCPKKGMPWFQQPSPLFRGIRGMSFMPMLAAKVCPGACAGARAHTRQKIRQNSDTKAFLLKQRDGRNEQGHTVKHDDLHNLRFNDILKELRQQG